MIKVKLHECLECHLMKPRFSKKLCLGCYNKLYSKPLKQSKNRIKHTSDKRAVKMEEYYALREVLLRQFPLCQVCGIKPSTEIHHKIDRQSHLLDNLLCVDRECHMKIHAEPLWAKEMGYLLSRFNNKD